MRKDGGLDLDVYHQRNIVIIRADGSITSNNCIELRDMVMNSLNLHKYFIIDCVDVYSMDSTAIGTLMSLVQEVQQIYDGDVKLAGLEGKVKHVLDLIDAGRVLGLYQTVTDAEASFSRERVG